MRLAYYAGASTAAAAACLLKAFHQRPNFYSATVYLSQSNACLLILTNLLLILSCGFLYGLQRVLYGRLRPIEIEQLSEKAWYAVLDTLLAMPSFREDVGGQLLVMFVLLLAGKVWGWIGEGRVDVLEQGQMPTGGNAARLFHGRLATSLIISVLFSFGMLKYCVDAVVEDPRPGMMVIFTFEFAVQCIFSTFTLARYGLSLVEMSVVKKQTAAAIEARKSEIKAEREAAKALARQEEREEPTFEDEIDVDENEVDVPGWEEKRRWLFGLELFTDMIKLVIYIFFFTVSITFNGLPMHIMRDVYMTFASFSKRITDYVAYRKATTEMNTRYPDATTEEIRGDSCIVCREEMVAWAEGEPQAPPQPQANAQPEAQAPAAPAPQPAVAPVAVPARRRDEGLRAKKLPCGHILHLRCLKAWLERQQVCPTCRRPVVTAAPPATNGAAGANPQAPGQPGQPGQHPPQQRPRGRVFNLGPLRIGLVNAPQGQVQNILNQIQHPEAAANQANAAQPPTADAAGNGAITTRIHGNSATSSVPIHIQLMQREQRLMRDAHNLGLDQQALANLRAMEAELARLRALRIPEQPPVGITAQPAPLQQFVPHLPFQQMGMGFPQPFQPPPPPPPTIMDQLNGNNAEQIASGSEQLPDGLVLPEGWTLMPLHRLGEQQHAEAPVQNVHDVIQNSANPSEQSVATSTSAQQHATNTNAAMSTTPAPLSADPLTAATRATEATAPPVQQAGAGPHGPTDDRGSPLFVPAQPSATIPAAAEASRTDTTQQAARTLADQPPSSQQSTSPHPTAPASWGGDSWSFVDQPEQATETTTPSNGHPPENAEEHTGQNGSYSGKGKGRAVEVEDVPDPQS
ncbi:ERAD-associated E3 ubiquitin-protein ligase HRD1 [Pseudocercospora fuligena]|uniref:RING-type E3 ubiquitin transferase n=1 Tax=Pseudocercospora fuligena TaxID=685502 RepID=A0A8H6RFJ9_9PEZI|nr:ERAD-associated E3 ubiquitin-protein ligase HRD1 [Pseudocercospora fuligena]